MTHQDLYTLLDFHYWARDRMFDAIEPLTPEQFTRDLGNSFRSVRDTVAHIYAAEWIWYERWQGDFADGAASGRPVSRCRDDSTARGLEHEQKVRALRRGARRRGRRRASCRTRSLAACPSTSPFWQMLQHVVNHASYHRGQVTTMLRQLGAAPAKSCDLITFYRELANTGVPHRRQL